MEIIEDEYSGQKILEIEVRGKRGVGYCKSMPGAVRPFERLRDRERPVDGASADNNPEEPRLEKPKPAERLFPNEFKKMFNGILTDAKLKFDRNGKARTAYSLRHRLVRRLGHRWQRICPRHRVGTSGWQSVPVPRRRGPMRWRLRPR